MQDRTVIERGTVYYRLIEDPGAERMGTVLGQIVALPTGRNLPALSPLFYRKKKVTAQKKPPDAAP